MAIPTPIPAFDPTQALERFATDLRHLQSLRQQPMAEVCRWLLERFVELADAKTGTMARIDLTLESVVRTGPCPWMTGPEAPALVVACRKALDHHTSVLHGTITCIPLRTKTGPASLVLLEAVAPPRLQLAKAFGEHVALELDNHRLYGELRAMNHQLQQRLGIRSRELNQSKNTLQVKSLELQGELHGGAHGDDPRVQQGKLAVVGQLAACVAHEINNPAASILTNLDVLREAVQSREERTRLLQQTSDPSRVERWEADNDYAARQAEIPELLDDATAGVHRIVNIVQELHSFGRSDPTDIRPVDVNELIEHALTKHSDEIRPCATVERDLAPIPRVWMVPGRMEQVFHNLIQNALQAMRSKPRNTQRLLVRTMYRKPLVEIQIHDTGCGIPEDQLASVVDPFYTTRGVNEGKGLGLSICKSIVESHRGLLDIESREDEGTCVRLRLDPQALKALATPFVAPNPTHPTRLLLVDDDVALLSSYRRWLKNAHNVATAAGGAQALQMLAEGADYDAVVCDLMMPDVSGCEVFRQVTDQHPDLRQRFIITTGGAFTPQAERFLAQEAKHILFKPFSAEDLTEVVEAVCNGPAPAVY